MPQLEFQEVLLAKIKDQLFKEELYTWYSQGHDYESALFKIAEDLELDVSQIVQIRFVPDIPKEYFKHVQKIDKKSILKDIERGKTIDGINILKKEN